MSRHVYDVFACVWCIAYKWDWFVWFDSNQDALYMYVFMCTHTHTHIHTHTNTHTYTYIPTHTARTHAQVCPHACTHVHTHTHALAVCKCLLQLWSRIDIDALVRSSSSYSLLPTLSHALSLSTHLFGSYLLSHAYTCTLSLSCSLARSLAVSGALWWGVVRRWHGSRHLTCAPISY